MKKTETIIIEKVLMQSLFGSNPKLAKEYGTTEVTIGFQRNKKEKELVDFMSYDPKKDIFRCYEIKVTMQDFHSNAKKSWYGDYNYLVLSKELFMRQPLTKWVSEIPDGVGIIVIDVDSTEKKTIVNPKQKSVSKEHKDVLRDSMIRTLFYQNQNNNWYLRK